MAFAAPAVHGAEKTKKYRTALVGAGWWGTNILSAAIESGTVEPIALCDVDENQLNASQEKLSKLTSASPRRYKDYRELLEREKPEIVIVGTPDHWHPLIAIAACEAGADVYVEKPISHTIREGTAMVRTARVTERVVQVGTHRRASPHNISGMRFLKDGKAGKIGMVAFALDANPFRISSMTLTFMSPNEAIVRVEPSRKPGHFWEYRLGLDNVPRIATGRFGLSAAGLGEWKSEDTLVVDINEIGNINRFRFSMKFETDTMSTDVQEFTGLGHTTFQGRLK